jgi:hypothetical protein
MSSFPTQLPTFQFPPFSLAGNCLELDGCLVWKRWLILLARYFPYWITVSSLTILFIFAMLWLISQRQLLPGIVIMGAFILFILWVVGLIVDSVELWGPSGVNSNCQLYVNAAESHGQSVDTLAYLEQHSICEFGPFLPVLPFGGEVN